MSDKVCHLCGFPGQDSVNNQVCGACGRRHYTEQELRLIAYLRKIFDFPSKEAISDKKILELSKTTMTGGFAAIRFYLGEIAEPVFRLVDSVLRFLTKGEQ